MTQEDVSKFMKAFTNLTHLTFGTRAAESHFDWGHRAYPPHSIDIAEEFPIPIDLLIPSQLADNSIPFPHLDTLELQFIKFGAVSVSELVVLKQIVRGRETVCHLDLTKCCAMFGKQPVVEFPTVRGVFSSTFEHDVVEEIKRHFEKLRIVDIDLNNLLSN